ncbi:DUF6531 domain-containing protein [Streptomyces sp. RPT161]|uniref:DUF6531 domain-containing protein n=1 Tax=Streptomyces sp. RPT161 TaxID=3015993 RepID=UPI0022B91881|nr:DUF6531 domain-containing protein [Streptomyces sp. RPT161]
MGVVLPDWAATMLDLIGVSWPNVDEDDYHHTADSLRDFAHDLDDNTGAANQHMQRLLASGRGQSMQALNAHWGKVKDKHLKDLATAATVVAGALDLAAGAITAQKGEAITQLGYLADETGIALALIPETGGLSALLDAGAIEATQQVVKQLFQEVAKDAVNYIVSALAEPAVAALDGMAVDLAIQLAADGMGVQDGVNLNEVKQAGKDGFHQGVGSAKTALHLDSVGGGDGGAGGGGGGGSDDVLIDHAEHERASTHLNMVGAAVHGKTRGQIFTARGHLGRTRGRGVIAEAIAPVAEKAVNALEKAATELGDHLKDRLPKAVQQISKDFRKADQDIEDGFHKLGQHHGRNDDLHLASNGPGRRSRYGKPDSLSEAKSDPRRHGIQLDNKTCKNDPVDVATGEMTLPQTDLSLPGVLPLVLRRTHLSGYRYGQWFGRSWASTLDERIELDTAGTGAVWAREDGSLLVYPRLPQPGGEPVLPLEGPRLPLSYGGDENTETVYQVTDTHTGAVRCFTGSPYNESTAYWLTELTDRNNRITIDRHGDGTPTAVIHHGGYTVHLAAEDQRIRTLSLRTPDGAVTVASYGFDEDGNLNAVTNSSGLPLRFTYDPVGRITSWTDRNDSTFQYVYDGDGRVVRTIGPDGFLSSTFAYEAHPETGYRITRYTNSTGATTVYHLNDRLQVVAETDPLGNTTRQTWDRDDHLLSRTDAQGHTTQWSWDEHGNLTAVREADGTVTTAEYDERGMPLVVTGPDGAVWRREYDEAGNNTALIAPDGTITRYAHDARGGITAITDALGATETFLPNPAGLPMARTDALGHAHTFTRDAFGHPTSLTDPLGAITHLEWNPEGNLLRRVEPDGSEQRWTYDGEGNCLTETDANGGITRYEYTHFDLVAARTEPGGARYEFTYDTELRLTEVRNSTGLTWNYAYDEVGRVIRETDFDGRTLTYTHDTSGRMVSRTNPLGQTVTHHYDALGRLATKDVDGAVTSFAYDPAGRLLQAQSPHATLELAWDAQGRLTAEAVDGRTHRYTYDAEGRRTFRTTPSGAVTTQTYDAAGNRTLMEFSGRPLHFTHDAHGQELTRTVGSSDRAVHLATAWDALGRVSEQSLAVKGRKLRSRAYTYRPDHHILAVTDQLTGQASRFTLDADGRPTGVDAHHWSERYLYDGEGNQTEATWPDHAPNPDTRGPRTYDGMRLRSAGALHYTYDAAGRVIERRRKRLSRKPDIWRYTWDAEDRLTSCTTPDGVLWTYTYDAFARRTAKRKHAPDGTVVEETVFAWDGGRLSEQTDTTTRTTLTWEYDGLRPLAQAESRQPSADQQSVDSRFFAIVTDLIGTPTELVSETGDIAWHSRPTLWGTTAWNRDASAYTPLRFPGQYADPETGLHYNHFRHYDPEPGRYVTPDPLGLAPAPNPAGYVTNPATISDPMGLAPCMDAMQKMAEQINNLKQNKIQREKQTVAIIHAQTPKGPVTFVSGTSKSKLDAEQVKLAKQLGLVPIPDDAYMKVPPRVKGGHAEQNILAYLSRLNHGKDKPDWLPTHGAASNSVCTDFCSPLIRGSHGAMYGMVYPRTQGTQQKQFYWPARHSPR